MINSKGFLGPIGDDLPSLIPLLFALVIFFSAFTFTFNVYQNNLASFSNDVSLLTISNILKKDSYLRNYSEFKNACGELKGISGINYKAMILPIPYNAENFSFNPVELVNTDKLTLKSVNESSVTVEVFKRPAGLNMEGDVKRFVCSNVPDEEVKVDSFDKIVSDNKNIFVRMFPIVFEDKLMCNPPVFLGTGDDPYLYRDVLNSSSYLKGNCTKQGFAVKPMLLVVVAWR